MRKWLSPAGKAVEAGPEAHLLEANRNIRELIEDTNIPSAVRAELSEEFEEISTISDKLRKSEIHIAAFGRVGVGKSSLLNALLHLNAFSTSPLHGETRSEERAAWRSHRDGNVILVDTPGIDEYEGAERSRLAQRISRRADIVLMLCEGDLTRSEFKALENLVAMQRTVLLVLNKADRYTAEETSLLLQRLRERTHELVPADRVIDGVDRDRNRPPGQRAPASAGA